MTDNGIQRALGRIEGTLGALDKRMGSYIEQTQEEKREIYKRLGQHDKAIAANASDIKNIRKAGGKAGAGTGGGIAAALIVIWEYIRSQVMK